MVLSKQDHPASDADHRDSSRELMAGIRLAYRCTHAIDAALA